MQFVCPRCSEEPHCAWTLGHTKNTETGPSQPTPFIWKQILFWLKGTFLRPVVSIVQITRIKMLEPAGPWQLGGVPKTHKVYVLSRLHGFSSSLVFQLPLTIDSFILAHCFCALCVQPLAKCCICVLCFWGRVKERKFLCSPGIVPAVMGFGHTGLHSRGYRLEGRFELSFVRGIYLIYFYPEERVEFEMCPDAFSQGHL